MMMKKDLSIYNTVDIASGCSAREFEYAIRKFYLGEYDAMTEVTLECELTSGERTTNCGSANVTDHIYTIKLQKSI